jgi:hypothetical protein
MTTTIFHSEESESGMTVEAFSGGRERGPCLQFTVDTPSQQLGYAQLRRIEVIILITKLVGWLL